MLVFTAIYNKYDVVRQPSIINPDVARWVCITDSEDPGGIWKSKIVNCDLSPRRCARKAKILFHKFFDDEIVIWHGGNVVLRGDINALVSAMGNCDIAVIKHDQRNCVYKEAEACKHWGLDDKRVIDAQMHRYKVDGYPVNNGLSAAFLIVRRNTAKIRELCDMWWEEVSNGSHRDQLSLDYCMWKTGIEPAIIPGNIYQGRNYKRFPTHLR